MNRSTTPTNPYNYRSGLIATVGGHTVGIDQKRHHHALNSSGNYKNEQDLHKYRNHHHHERTFSYHNHNRHPPHPSTSINLPELAPNATTVSEPSPTSNKWRYISNNYQGYDGNFMRYVNDKNNHNPIASSSSIKSHSMTHNTSNPFLTTNRVPTTGNSSNRLHDSGIPMSTATTTNTHHNNNPYVNNNNYNRHHHHQPHMASSWSQHNFGHDDLMRPKKHTGPTTTTSHYLSRAHDSNNVIQPAVVQLQQGHHGLTRSGSSSSSAAFSAPTMRVQNVYAVCDANGRLPKPNELLHNVVDNLYVVNAPPTATYSHHGVSYPFDSYNNSNNNSSNQSLYLVKALSKSSLYRRVRARAPKLISCFPATARPNDNNSSSNKMAAAIGIAEEDNAMFREYMEDGWLIDTDFLSSSSDQAEILVGVFDGHGGRRAVDFTVSNFSRIYANEVEVCKPGETRANVLEKAFLRTDEHLRAIGCYHEGSTATICAIRAEEETNNTNSNLIAYIAGVGDSRCISVTFQGNAVRLSFDHKATDMQERDRVLRDGGNVFRGRVAGQLAVSRALGDHSLKGRDGVSAFPTVFRRNLQNDRCLILATDGLWDVVGDQEAANVCLACIQETVNNNNNNTELVKAADFASRTLVALALERGSRDNTTVMVLVLPNGLDNLQKR